MAHPDENSFSQALAQAYQQSAEAAGHETFLLSLSKLQFDPILHYAYKQRISWEPDLELAWEKITWCDHMVWVYPTWWGTMPALMKGFIDRLFIPGFAFKYRDGSPFWDKLLKGKSARIITTMDSPVLYNFIVYRSAGHHIIKDAVLKFCGVSPVKITTIGNIKWKKVPQIQQWLTKVRSLGASGI